MANRERWNTSCSSKVYLILNKQYKTFICNHSMNADGSQIFQTQQQHAKLAFTTCKHKIFSQLHRFCYVSQQSQLINGEVCVTVTVHMLFPTATSTDHSNKWVQVSALCHRKRDLLTFAANHCGAVDMNQKAAAPAAYMTCSNRSTSPARRAHSSKPATCRCTRWDRQTDGYPTVS